MANTNGFLIRVSVAKRQQPRWVLLLFKHLRKDTQSQRTRVLWRSRGRAVSGSCCNVFFVTAKCNKLQMKSKLIFNKAHKCWLCLSGCPFHTHSQWSQLGSLRCVALGYLMVCDTCGCRKINTKPAHVSKRCPFAGGYQCVAWNTPSLPALSTQWSPHQPANRCPHPALVTNLHMPRYQNVWPQMAAPSCGMAGARAYREIGGS